MKRLPFKVLSPTAILGYGFPIASFEAGLHQHPDVIAVDAGSTDPGPYYLGSGKSFTNRSSVKRDLEILLKASAERSIPCIIGTAGGSGSKEHVDWTVSIIREICEECDYRFRLGVIYADISREDVLESFESGHIMPMPSSPQLFPDDIRQSTRIVAQMGSEPVISALKQQCQVIVCGRCYDPVPFAALPIMKGYDPALALHMGKILECAAIAAAPGSGSDCVMGILYDQWFELESLNPDRKFTRLSTAAHTLYEKSDPYHLPGPGGSLDLNETRFEAVAGERVRVCGTRFTPADQYYIKLEGVRPLGFRTISIAGIRDPILIPQIDDVLRQVEGQVKRALNHKAQVLFHIYGKNGVMGALEPVVHSRSHELGIIIEVIAADQQQADAVCSYIRSTLLHYGYPGRISTAGNLALLYSPSDISCGQVYEFSVYHLMAVDDPLKYFPVTVFEAFP